MKHLLTLVALLISSLAMGQFPNLPYNPDDNGDGLIGVADLQTLLANYGSEFASAVVSEDGESAIVYMGEMAFPPCALACRSLPGMWETASTVDLGLVWNEVYSTGIDNFTWLKPSSGSNVPGLLVSQDESSYVYHEAISEYKFIARQARCYCAVKQLPRVEYDWCYGSSGSNDPNTAMTECLNEVKECANEKLASGWQLLGTTQAGSPSRYVQALWRWAE